MVQMGGCGRRSPFSSMSGISLVGMPSYGLPPNVISSQMVTPGGRGEGAGGQGRDKEPEINREQDEQTDKGGENTNAGRPDFRSFTYKKQ